MRKNTTAFAAFIVALIVADLLTDIAFLASVYGNEEKDEDFKDKHPLIGRRYKVGDNSYIKDIESGVDSGIGLYGREVIIVSDPYVEETKEFWQNEPTKHLFVNVFSTDSSRKYRVLFDEGWLINEE